jgi:hypothetical protein
MAVGSTAVEHVRPGRELGSLPRTKAFAPRPAENGCAREISPTC